MGVWGGGVSVESVWVAQAVSKPEVGEMVCARRVPDMGYLLVEVWW
jgi:hypothetical protein